MVGSIKSYLILLLFALCATTKGQQLSENCEHVCNKDKCMGTYTNPIPKGEQWDVKKESATSTGCCGITGSGSCDICCKPGQGNSEPPSSSPLSPSPNVNTLKIGSFNVQVFGKSKMEKTNVVKVLLNVLQRWDLVLVQEVRDSSGTAIQDLHDQLNTASGNKYSLFLSERLGRTSSKEQLAWFYRKDKIKKVGDEQVADPNDHWERPPQVTYWDLVGNGKVDDTVGIIGIHVDPDDAVKEIDELAPVMDSVIASGKAKGGVWIMGDLNADCSYITKTEWKCIRDSSCSKTTMRLYNPKKYKWMIDDDADTTTKSTNCAYDRFVFSLPVPPQVSNVGVYEFGSTLSKEDLTQVSDHYPIEFTWSSPSKGTHSTSSDTNSSMAGASSGAITGGCGVSSNNMWSSFMIILGFVLTF
jgi:endonuclease/exonuclease/phosphatase family metal-dependent hydrolase